MSTAITAPCVSAASFLGINLYYIEEVGTVLLVLLVAFVAIGLLLLLWISLWEAGKYAIALAKRISRLVFAVSHQALPHHRPLGLHVRR